MAAAILGGSTAVKESEFQSRPATSPLIPETWYGPPTRDLMQPLIAARTVRC